MIEELESMHGYKINEKIGEGSFGVVLSATRLEDNKQFAIKLYKEPFKTQYIARQTYREINLMRRLSEMKGNSFTPHIVDLFFPSSIFAHNEEAKSMSPGNSIDLQISFSSFFGIKNDDDKISNKNQGANKNLNSNYDLEMYC